MAFEVEKQICYECGRSVAPGHGLYVDRVASVDTIQGRKEMDGPFPEGGWLCRDCDEKIFG